MSIVDIPVVFILAFVAVGILFLIGLGMLITLIIGNEYEEGDEWGNEYEEGDEWGEDYVEPRRREVGRFQRMVDEDNRQRAVTYQVYSLWGANRVASSPPSKNPDFAIDQAIKYKRQNPQRQVWVQSSDGVTIWSN